MYSFNAQRGVIFLEIIYCPCLLSVATRNTRKSDVLWNHLIKFIVDSGKSRSNLDLLYVNTLDLRISAVCGVFTYLSHKHITKDSMSKKLAR